MTNWHDPRLETAYDALDDASAEIHPEHGEHDAVQRAMDAIEAADMALERFSKIRRGEPPAIRIVGRQP